MMKKGSSGSSSDELAKVKNILKEGNTIINTNTTTMNNMNNEVIKGLKSENEKLTKKLDEERDCRKEIEKRSAGLVFEIKAQEQKKNAELQNVINYQKDLIAQKDNQILDLEDTINSERSGSKNLQQKLQKTIQNKGEQEKKTAKSVRGSISLMESQLTRTTTDLENKIQEMSIKHAQDLATLKKEYNAAESKLKELLANKDVEIQNLEGRLEQARLNRETNLVEMDQILKKYVRTISQLEKTLTDEIEKNKLLQKEKEEVTFNEKEELENELEKAKFERNELTIRLDVIEKENHGKDQKLNEMSELVTRMEKSIQAVEQQKVELLQMTTEYFNKNQDYDKQQGAVEILQEQLEKCQKNLDETKEVLVEQKHANRELEKNFTATEKELNNAKIDLRITQREAKDLEVKIAKLIDDLNEAKEKKNEYEVQINTATAKYLELQVQVDTLKIQVDEITLSKKNLEILIDEKTSKIKSFEDGMKQTTKEIGKFKDELKELENLRSSLQDQNVLIAEKVSQLEEKDIRIDNLNANIMMLKEACSVLETQLTEYEGLLNIKTDQLNEEVKTRAELEKTNTSLKDELRKSKAEINEVRSLQVFAEKKSQEIELSQKTILDQKENEIACITEQMNILKKRSEEILEQYSQTFSSLKENKENRAHLTHDVQKLQIENQHLQEEVSRLIAQLVKLKESNMKLTEGLSESIQKGEGYKFKVESLKEKMCKLEEEKERFEVKYDETIKQQQKLIQHLQDQNEILTKKSKHTFANMIFGRQQTSATPSKDKYIGSKIIGTPRKLLEEEKEVKSLEVEAEQLRNHFAELQKEKERSSKPGNDHVEKWVEMTKSQSQLSLSRIRKEDCILLTEGVSNDKYRFTKDIIFADESEERVEINCVKYFFGDIYLFGCDQGLFSKRLDNTRVSEKVKIHGPSSIHQIELIYPLNYALMIEGEERRIIIVDLRVLRVSAEAAECSRPKIKFQLIEGLKNVNFFQIQKAIGSQPASLFVATPSGLSILFWKQDTFVLRKAFKTNESITCLLPRENSVIFGCETIYEVDLKTLRMEKFIDESDESLFFVMTNCRNFASYPIAILEVSMSNIVPGDLKQRSRPEFLLCFSALGVFVDDFGKRSRSEDIVWSKSPVSVIYRHPNLYIIHFTSVEIIPLTPTSFTKGQIRSGENKKIRQLDSNSQPEIPTSKYFQIAKPKFLGLGTNSLIVGSLEKNKTEVLSIYLTEAEDEPQPPQKANGDLNATTQSSTSTSSSVQSANSFSTSSSSEGPNHQIDTTSSSSSS